MVVGVLLKTYQYLHRLVKMSPPNSIKLNIPETIFCSFDKTVIYIFTNSKGFLEVEQFND